MARRPSRPGALDGRGTATRLRVVTAWLWVPVALPPGLIVLMLLLDLLDRHLTRPRPTTEDAAPARGPAPRGEVVAGPREVTAGVAHRVA
ncbi:hypothetical protein [Actinomycetospora cinnamomea]|uniref:Uncharacterized protein n=1 Tax=Actinomycetospora cinnamomea TaxID=663609 RepID=A0A2U1F2I9_9PSEU|nr:hypothetical protein [Actinomycetospora cinnamomea]PVZ06349.1 hypothetical protein C8D89_11387 [Actinomycetospora cinnamomea]